MLTSSSGENLNAFLARFVAKVIDPIDGTVSSAFFVNEQGALLTCWHVVDPDFKLKPRDWVWLEYRSERYRADLVQNLSNWKKDILVLQVQGADFTRLKATGFERAPLAFPSPLAKAGDFAFLRADPVAALGFQRHDPPGTPHTLQNRPLLLRGHVDPDNPQLTVHVTGSVSQDCLAVVFRNIHFDKGLSGSPLLNTRSGRVIGIVAGVLPSTILPVGQPLGFAVPLTDVPLAWADFKSACGVIEYEPHWDTEIVPQSKELVRHETFTERPLWSELVEKFVAEPQRRGGYLLLVAGEGEGKSALLCNCIANRVEPIFHIIRRTEPGWDNPERMLLSLAAQVVRKHGVPVNAELKARLDRAGSEAARTQAAAEMLADLLDGLSRMLLPHRAREVLWIDGLDEAFGPTGRYHETPGLPGLLPAHLPPGIFAVLTSRPGDHLHWLRDPTLCTSCRLEDERPTNIDHVHQYFEEHGNDVDPPLEAGFSARAAARTQGNFYIAVHKLAELVQNPRAPRDPDTIPGTVREYHAQVFQRVVARANKENIKEAEVHRVLGTLAEARDPLTLEDLEAFAVSQSAEEILKWSADYFRPRPADRAPTLAFEFNHTSVPEFVLGQLSHTQRGDIHSQLATACLKWKGLRGSSRRYALRYLPTHLLEASKAE